MHDCTFASHSRWKWVEGLKRTCVSALFFLLLFHLSILSPLFQCVVTQLTKVLPSFLPSLAVYVPFGELFLFSSSILSVLYLYPVMRLTINPSLSSDPFFLLFCSPLFTSSHQSAPLFLTSIFSFSVCRPFPHSLPSVSVCDRSCV